MLKSKEKDRSLRKQIMPDLLLWIDVKLVRSGDRRITPIFIQKTSRKAWVDIFAPSTRRRCISFGSVEAQNPLALVSPPPSPPFPLNPTKKTTSVIHFFHLGGTVEGARVHKVIIFSLLSLTLRLKAYHLVLIFPTA